MNKTIVIIPTYNERKNAPALAGKLFELYPEISVLFVDDNSPDDTAGAVKGIQTRFANLHLLERTSDRGFGRSYIDGLKKILNDDRYDFIVMMDADFSHDPRVIGAMTACLKSYPIVIGSRYVRGGRIENWSWRRKLLSRFANFYVKLILNLPAEDVTTGFMCFRKSALDRINLDLIRSDGYAFLVELKYRLVKAGLKIYEHPITFDERREGQSKMSVKNIWEAIWLPWKLKVLRK